MKKILAVLLFASSLNAKSEPLDNVDRYVGAVDIMKTHTVIWIGGDRNGQPESCSKYAAISCWNNEEYCQSIVSTALAARLSNRKVEYSFSGECNYSFSEVKHFRMMD